MLSCAARSAPMKLSEIRATLKEIGISPAKALGQNFLHDQNLARWIVDQAQITAEDYVVEIGPGLGALTRFLLEKGAHVLAIEKDARLAKFLRSRFGDERLEIVNTDALKFDPRILFCASLREVDWESAVEYFESVTYEIPRTSKSYLVVFVDITEGDGHATFRVTVRPRLRGVDVARPVASSRQISAQRSCNCFSPTT